VRTTPGQMHEFAVRGCAPDYRVAIGKLARQLSESCDFRRADERKVLRPKSTTLSSMAPSSWHARFPLKYPRGLSYWWRALRARIGETSIFSLILWSNT